MFASVKQAGHRLWPAFSSQFIFPVDVHFQGFTPDDFSNLKLSPPHQREQLCQMGSMPANRTTATPVTSYQWTLPSTPEQLGYFRAVLSSCVPSSISRSHLYGLTAGRTQPRSHWPGSPLKGRGEGTVPGPNHPKPLLKIPLWLHASSAESFCLLRCF